MFERSISIELNRFPYEIRVHFIPTFYRYLTMRKILILILTHRPCLNGVMRPEYREWKNLTRKNRKQSKRKQGNMIRNRNRGLKYPWNFILTNEYILLKNLNIVYVHRKERELADVKRKAQHHLIDDGEAQKKLQELEIQKAEAEKKVESIQKEEKVSFVDSQK